MKVRAYLSASAAITAVALLLTGCAGEGDVSKPSAQTAVMYTSNNETVVDVVTAAAKAHDPSIKVEAVTGSTGPLLQRIQSESTKPAADVFYSAPAASFEKYIEYIEPYDSPETSAIPTELLDPEGRWTPTNTHVVAFMANVDQIDSGKAPTTWKDLLDPKWKGKIIIADPAQSSTAFTALYGAYKLLGEADFATLAANLETTESSSNVYPAVAQGEYAIAIAYESNIYPYIVGGQAGIEMIYPEDGTFVEYDAALLVKNGPNVDAGKILIDTILSKETQTQNLEQSFRRPVRSDINVSDFVDFKSLDELTVVDIHEDEDKQGRDAFTKFWANL